MISRDHALLDKVLESEEDPTSGKEEIDEEEKQEDTRREPLACKGRQNTD